MSMTTMVQDLFQVILAGLVLGAGLPAIFALGVRLSSGDKERGSSVAHAASYVCFAVVIIAIVLGIMWITKATLYQTFGLDVFGTEAA